MNKVWHKDPVIAGALGDFDCFSIVDGNKAIHKVWWLHYQDRKNGTKWVQEVTLIARSIESLSDKELDKAFHIATGDDMLVISGWVSINRKEAISIIKRECSNKISLDLFLYFTSIGVWPGSKEGVEFSK